MKMDRRLVRTAVFASPVIAAYGMTPVMLTDTYSLASFVVGFVFLSLMILAFWIGNIYLFGDHPATFRRHLLSYLGTFLIHLVILLLIPDFPDPEKGMILIVYPLVSTIAINTIILIVIHAQLTKIRQQNAEAEIQELRVESLEAQKKVLQQQLQPHFLFNALSILKSLIRENQDDAEEYTVKLSEFLRYSIKGHNNEAVVSLGEEIVFTRDYLELQKMRFREALQFSVSVPEEAYPSRIPVFALQTLAENAIKHNNISEKRPLHFSISLMENELVAINNRTPKVLQVPSGTGLKNLSDRYALICGKKPIINSDEHSFTVRLPLL
jgi:two-component system, LytTR family, sensor kinase